MDSGGDCLCCPGEGFRPGLWWHPDALCSPGPGAGLQPCPQTAGLWLCPACSRVGAGVRGPPPPCCPSPSAQRLSEGQEVHLEAWRRPRGRAGPLRSLIQGVLLGEGPACWGALAGQTGRSRDLEQTGVWPAELRAWAVEPSRGDKGQSVEPRGGRTLCDPEGLVLRSPRSRSPSPCVLPLVPPPPEAEQLGEAQAVQLLCFKCAVLVLRTTRLTDLKSARRLKAETEVTFRPALWRGGPG